MLKSPALYSVTADYQDDDPGLKQKRANIIHSVAAILEKCKLIKYERASGRFQSTKLGRIMSHFYVTHNSMSVYNQHLRLTMSQLELPCMFALSNEPRGKQGLLFSPGPAIVVIECYCHVLLGEAQIWQVTRTCADSG